MWEGSLGECDEPGHQSGPETRRNVQEQIATDYLTCDNGERERGWKEREGTERERGDGERERGWKETSIYHPTMTYVAYTHFSVGYMYKCTPTNGRNLRSA